MKRREFCAVVGIESPLFDAHRRTGNLPFDLDGVEQEAGQGRRWARFTVHEAAAWIAVQHLAAQGVTWSEGAKILRERKVYLCGASGYGHHPIEEAGHFVARAEFRREDNTESDMAPRFRIYRGQIASIAKNAAAYVDDFNTHQRFAASRIVMAGMIAANLSHAYSIARGRMKAVGIKSVMDPQLESPAAETGGDDA